MLVLGNYDVRTMEYACKLWVEGWSEYVIYTCVIESSKFACLWFLFTNQ